MCIEIEAGVGGTATAYCGPHVLWSRDNELPAVDPDQYLHVEPSWNSKHGRGGWPMGNETSK